MDRDCEASRTGPFIQGRFTARSCKPTSIARRESCAAVQAVQPRSIYSGLAASGARLFDAGFSKSPDAHSRSVCRRMAAICARNKGGNETDGQRSGRARIATGIEAGISVQAPVLASHLRENYPYGRDIALGEAANTTSSSQIARWDFGDTIKIGRAHV